MCIKDDALIEIVESVKSVAAGRHFVSPQLTSHLVARHAQAGAAAEQTPGIDALTETERKVLRLLAEFKTTKEIAAALVISPRTVDRHRSNMAEKLGSQRQPRADQVRGGPHLRSLKRPGPSPFSFFP